MSNNNTILEPTRPIDQCLSFPKGTPIESICGTVGFVGTRFTGVGQYGPYSMQTIGIGDGVNQCLVVLANREELRADYRGSDLWFSSWQGDKGLIGVKTGTTKDKDKNEVACIMVNKTAVILDADGNDPAPKAEFAQQSNAPQPPARPAPPSRPAAPAPHAAPAAPTRPATPAPATRMTAGGIVRGEYISLDHLVKVQMDGLARAFDAVEHLEKHKIVPLFGEPLSMEDRRSCAIAMLIEANRSGAIWGKCANRFSDQKDPNVTQAAPTPPPTNGGGDDVAPEDWHPED